MLMQIVLQRAFLDGKGNGNAIRKVSAFGLLDGVFGKFCFIRLVKRIVLGTIARQTALICYTLNLPQ